MRLKEVKLSGFKTFVDPTRVRVSHNLAGIVGPNGCGKSNLVEAVSWVMGELSTRRLRSEHLVDVIFNGSGTRKPVGQATVELVLDNSAGDLKGRYAAFREISVRRLLGRDGTAAYFLNGVSCRRRDVQELFLGTGVTPGSYAIIGQGMISRLVDAKPEELRLFLEEAAGTSRYRKQRRETLSRMRSTSENINVISSVRNEVKSQLKKLATQARAAKRYQLLQSRARELEAALLAREREQHWERLEERRLAEGKAKAGLEELKSVLSGLEQRLREQQAERDRGNDGYNHAQAAFYEIGSGISELEQQLNFLRQRLEEQRTEWTRGTEEEQRMRKSLEQEQGAARELRELLQQEEPELKAAGRASAESERRLRALEEAWRKQQDAWGRSLEAMALQERELEKMRARLEHVEAELVDTGAREEELRRTLEAIDVGTGRRRVAAAHAALGVAEQGQRDQETRLQELRAELRESRSVAVELEQKLEQRRARLRGLEARFHSLNALQEVALGRRDGDAATEAWLRRHGLKDSIRLGECLRVEEGWEGAVELVLGHHLRDLVVEDPAACGALLQELEEGAVGLCATAAPEELDAEALLYSRLRAPRPPAGWLHGVYCAADLEEARALLPRLEQGQSVVTRDGIWLGQGWVCMARGAVGGLSGLLEREEERQKLRGAGEESRAELNTLEAGYREAREGAVLLEKQLDAMQEPLQQARLENSRRLAEWNVVQGGQQQLKERHDRLEQELAGISTRRARQRQEAEALHVKLTAGQNDREALEQRSAGLVADREASARKLDDARSRWREHSAESHRISLRVQERHLRMEALEGGVAREREQLERWEKRSVQLREAIRLDEAHAPELQGRLRELLEERGRREQVLSGQRRLLEDLSAAGQTLEQEKSLQEQLCREAADVLQQRGLEVGEARVRLEGMDRELQRLETTPEQALQAVHGIEPEQWPRRLERLRVRLERLGAVNPAAVEEVEQLRERHGQLDSQLGDMEEALANLRQAIRKIDRESRTRFESTFQRVNEKLGNLFRRLFDGGGARLELLGDDPLEAGIVMLAQPPGKRNRNIQQLSGGEKALAALALVFSIFQLNPAPFCILDEVDAPLDDINVARFLVLLRELSETVQFLLVTHHRLSMETMDMLLGVTMPEAGVSQVLSVEVEEAARMAAAG